VPKLGARSSGLLARGSKLAAQCSWPAASSHDFQRPRQAVFTEAAVLDIDPLHRMRRRHGALIIVAMGEPQGVSQLMHRLDEQAIGQHVPVWRKPVKFLLQAMIGRVA